jgi:DNA-directed RNA polymerase specialized sigma subunit
MDQSSPLDKSAILTATVVRYRITGDQEACARAVELMMPNITRLAKSLAQKSFGLAPVEDLIGAGIEECLRCINNYAIGEGPFLQYALRSVQGNMFHFLRDKTLDVRVSGRAKETMYAVNKFIRLHTRKTGEVPDLGTICRELGYSITRVEDALKITQFVTSPRQIEDYAHVAIANLDGTPEAEDPDSVSPEDAKQIVARMVELRKEGKNAQDFMALYGIDESVAVDLVEAIDMHFITKGSSPRFSSLVDWATISLGIESDAESDITI